MTDYFSSASAATGTFAYAAPEILMGKPTTEKVTRAQLVDLPHASVDEHETQAVLYEAGPSDGLMKQPEKSRSFAATLASTPCLLSHRVRLSGPAMMSP